MKIAVLSDGGWGTALALVLNNNEHDVFLWGPFPDYIDELKTRRENYKFLAGIPLPANLHIVADMAEAVNGAEVIVLASPSQYMRATLTLLKPHYSPNQILVNVAKGIEIDSLMTMGKLCKAILGECNYCVLSGPSHAEEVAKGVPTAVVVASANKQAAETVQNCFMNSFFRVYTTDDVIGVELGGSLKNVFAIAAGIIDGMTMGDNPKAALMTRGIAELARLGTALGGKYETFSGLSGIGDLIVTCCSGHSRNRHVGEELGRGKTLQTIIEDMGMVVAEGVKTAKSAHELATAKGVDTPIVSQIYAVLYDNKDPHQSVHDLMTRRARTERDIMTE